MKTRRPAYHSTILIVACSVFVLALATAAARATPAAHGLHVVTRTLAASSRGWSYDWPIRPFDRQHPVRAFIDDPRIAPSGRGAFHFGIDIAAPDGTPVYSVEAGTVYFDSPVAIAVVAPDRSHSFGYWHIVPGVRSHEWVGRHQLLGWIGKGWGHVHFAQRRGSEYVNPLRPGGIGPYVDRSAPTVTAVYVTAKAIVVEAHDTPSPAVPGAWRGEPVTPALLRWRLARRSAWTTFVDFRRTMLPAALFRSVFAPQTLQNHKGIAGRFCFYMLRGAKAAAALKTGLPIEIQAVDSAGNSTTVVWLDD
jgi:hypothetical protein